MITLIATILISTLFIYGWSYCITYTPTGLIEMDKNEEMNPFGTSAENREIAWWFKFYLGNFIWNYLPILKPMLKPLFMCEVCMSSVYGSLIYWILMIYTAKITVLTFIIWPFIIVSIAGLNRLVKIFIQR
jgi:hypothetical protein